MNKIHIDTSWRPSRTNEKKRAKNDEQNQLIFA